MAGTYDDMVRMDSLTAEGMLDNLLRRFEKQLIYTYTGSILVAFNPYELLPIYSNNDVKTYVGKRIGLEPPHIFAIANSTYSALRDFQQNQSVIVSGESGAGKTETTKLVLQFMAAATGKHSEVEQKILQSSPLLEAFGNAKTVRNNNSSRFGKFIKVEFDSAGCICGAQIDQYLLEKSRLVFQAETERNYHVFYQMCAGASDAEAARWKLRKPQQYRLLNQSGCIEIPGVDDEKHFGKTKAAMKFLGMSDVDVDHIFTVVAAVLSLGNVEFKAKGDGSEVKNMDELKIAAGLLRVPEADLATALCQKTLVVVGSSTIVPLTVKAAEAARDSLAKMLYARLFEWIVERTNRSIVSPGGSKGFIGVLDIFGFENFKVNSFEQQCINFTNEKLQLAFNDAIFKVEQEEYEREKIDWSKVTYRDNQLCINLIESTKPPGIIALLDEETRFPKATDSTFLEKICTAFAKHEYFERPKKSRTSYVIKHYAGDVAYEVADFLDKNRDMLPIDLLQVVFKAGVSLVKEAFKRDAEVMAEGGKRVPTVAGNFKNQLNSLMTVLASTQRSYVRCIKPNTVMKPRLADSEMVMAQLRYAGMLETIRIRAQGLPRRFLHQEFAKRYGVCVEGLKRGTDAKTACKAIVDKVKMPDGTIQIGVTKVLMREAQYAALEDLRNKALANKIVTIQAWWRMMMVRMWYLTYKGAAIVVQQTVRRYLCRKAFKRQRAAARVMQAAARMIVVRKAKVAEMDRRRVEIRKRAEEARKRQEEEEKRRKAEEEKRAKEEAARKAQEDKDRAKILEKQSKELAKKSQKAGYASAELSPLAVPSLNTADLAGSPGDSLGSGRSMMPATPGSVLGGGASARPGGSAVGAGAAAAAGGPAPIGTDPNKQKWRPYVLLDGIETPKSIVVEEELAAYTMLEYASNNFRSVSTGAAGSTGTAKKGGGLMGTLKRAGSTMTLKRGGTMTPQEMLMFTRDKQTTSLHNFDDLPNGKELVKAAVENFAQLQNYVCSRGPEQWVDVQLILRRGMMTEALRDEIYCQALKMTLGAPDDGCLKRAWEMMAFIICSFMPSQKFLPFVAGYCYGNSMREDIATVGEGASFCIRALERAVLRVSRRGAYRNIQPSLTELQAIQKRELIKISVFTLDGSQYEVEVDSATSINETIGALVKQVKLQDPSFFSLYEVFTSVQDPSQRLDRSLFVEEYVCDALSKAEHARAYRFQFLFKRKIWLAPREMPTDPLEIALCYHQAIAQIADGTLPVSEEDAIKFAALAVHCKHGASFKGKVNVEDYIPPSYRKRYSAEVLNQMILAAYTANRETESADKVQRRVLYNCTHLTFYGSSLFAVENANNTAGLPKELVLAVNIEGFHYVTQSGDDYKITNTFFFSDVSIDYTASQVKLLVDDSVTGKKNWVTFNCKRGIEIYNLYRDYFYWLQAQSEWARASEAYAVDDKMLLAFAEGELIHVVDKENPEWYKGEIIDASGKTLREGMFPAGSVTLLLRAPPEAPKITRSERRRPTLSRASGDDAGASDREDDLGRRRTGTLNRGRRNTNNPVRAARAPTAQVLSAATADAADSRTRRSTTTSFADRAKGRAAAAAPEKWRLDPLDFAFDRWAREQFRAGAGKTKKTGVATLRKDKGGEPHQFSKDPLKEPLLPLFKANEAQQKLACECFKAIMRFCGDLPRDKKTPQSDFAVQVCSAGMDNEVLQDELMCQVMKQITGNPNMSSMQSAWALLCLLCGLWLPSTEFLPYLVSFLLQGAQLGGIYSEIAELAKDSLDKLARLREDPEFRRIMPPSAQEIDATLQGGQLACLVYLPDGSSKTIDVDSVTSVAEMVSQIPQKNYPGWGLAEVISAGSAFYHTRVLTRMESICDVMARWERFPLPKTVTGSIDFVFEFRKCTFLSSEDEEERRTPGALPLVVHQLHGDIVRGRLTVSEEDLVALCGLLLQVQFGPATDPANQNAQPRLESMIGKYVPESLLTPKGGGPVTTVGAGAQGPGATLKKGRTQRRPKKDGPDGALVAQWLSRLQLSWGLHGDKKQLDAATEYVKRLREHPLFGAQQYFCSITEKRKQKPCVMGVGEAGVSIWPVGEVASKPLMLLKYDDLASFAPAYGSISITSGNLANPNVDTFITEASFDIAAAITVYQNARVSAALAQRKARLGGKKSYL